MELEIVSTSIKFSYLRPALELLLRKVETTIKTNPPIIETILAHTNDKVTATMSKRYPPKVTKDSVLKALTPGNPPAVTPMHQMYLAQGRDPDWAMRLGAVSPPQIMVLAELLLLWQSKQANYFLTRQLTSIISMGMVNYFLETTQNLPSTMGRDVMLGPGGIPQHLETFAKQAFGPLGWSRFQYLPARETFEAAGHSLVAPNPNATHP